MFSKKLLVCVSVVAMSMVLSACGSDSDDTPSNAGDTSTPVDGGGDGDGDGANGAPSGLAGTWVRGCTADDPEDAETEYSTSVAVFTSDSASITDNSYTDSGCTTAADPAVIAIEYSLVFPGGTTTTNLGNAVHINVTPESALFDGEPLSDELANLFELNQTDYDIILIANDMLYAGDIDGDLDGTTEALRPTAIDTEFVYSRQ